MARWSPTYAVDRMMEDGRLQDMADAARRLGVTRARMSQIAALPLLPVQIGGPLPRGQDAAEVAALAEFRHHEPHLLRAVGSFQLNAAHR